MVRPNVVKRFVISTSLGAFLLLVSGCGSSAVDTPEAKEHATNQSQNRANNLKKVAAGPRGGNTKQAAGRSGH